MHVFAVILICLTAAAILTVLFVALVTAMVARERNKADKDIQNFV